MKSSLIAALAVALIAAAPLHADAKRLGAGKPAGMQRNMPAKTAPDAAPAKPAAAPQQAAPATPAAAPATPPKRNWMGPLAGLAAGLGIAALLSHFGMGGAAANFLMMALLAGGAVLLVMFLLRRFGPKANVGMPAMAGAGAGAGGAPLGGNGGALPWSGPAEPVAAPAPLNRSASASTRTEAAPATLATAGTAAAAAAPLAAAAAAPLAAVTSTATAEPAVTRAFVPAAFDSESFTRTAKMIFIRLQTANDTADLDDLRRFTTPELFASLRLDLQDRAGAAQTTDVVKVDAEVLDVANEADRQIVSVRFHGQVVEDKGAAAVDFNEVWHLVKPHDDSHAWTIAGIEQMS